MAHVDIANHYPCQVEILYLTAADGGPVAGVVCKSTYQILSDGLLLAEKQQPIYVAGETYGKPGESSYRYEPECAYVKPNTDVVLVGSAVSPRGPVTSLDVEFEVGPVRKQARIVGNRFWVRGLWGANMSAPEPFTEMPLVWERASGGWDRSHVDPEFHTCDKRNPFGVGFQRDFGPTQDQIPLPNIEDVNDPVTTLGRRTKPCGFGFINPDWEPRASYAGTYDKDWIETKMPLLPDDFDLRFFNAASPGLITSGYLAGNEQVFVRNCGKEEKLEFELPGAPAPSCRFRIAKQQDVQLTGNLDTVVVNVAEETVTLTYRCHVPLALGFDRLREVQITPHQ